MTEPDGGAGSDPAMLTTTARQDGNDWVINGRKWLITGARRRAASASSWRAPATRATMFLADMDAPGIVIERVLDTHRHVDARRPRGVRLEGVRVPDDQVLGEVDEGFRYAQVRLAPARLTHCMRWWGAAQRAHDIAIDYACRRQAFGKPLIEHEGVGFMLADNEIDLQQARADDRLRAPGCSTRATRAARRVEHGEVRSAPRRCIAVADRCVQVLGGLGVTDDTPVAQIFRDIRAFRIYDGPSEVHRWSLARRLQRNHAKAQAAPRRGRLSAARAQPAAGAASASFASSPRITLPTLLRGSWSITSSFSGRLKIARPAAAKCARTASSVGVVPGARHHHRADPLAHHVVAIAGHGALEHAGHLRQHGVELLGAIFTPPRMMICLVGRRSGRSAGLRARRRAGTGRRCGTSRRR